MSSLYQSAINLSEGRRLQVLGAVREAVRSVDGACLADQSMDYDHNRMVVTVLGGANAVSQTALAIARIAVAEIDLRRHTGVHPRIGAIDVVPFVPIREATMTEAVEIGQAVGRAFADDLGLPVYLYEQSSAPGRLSALPDLRRGGFEGLFERPLTGLRAPDFGPAAPHPSAGVAVVGARAPLVAYNVNLESTVLEGQTAHALAKSVAASIRRERETVPTLAGARALGLELPSQGAAQVSINLTRPQETPLPAVFDFVKTETRRQALILAPGTELPDEAFTSEIIGLIPHASLGGESPERIRWKAHKVTQLLEYWMERL